jgi:hypothetical protein
VTSWSDSPERISYAVVAVEMHSKRLMHASSTTARRVGGVALMTRLASAVATLTKPLVLAGL